MRLEILRIIWYCLGMLRLCVSLNARVARKCSTSFKVSQLSEARAFTHSTYDHSDDSHAPRVFTSTSFFRFHNIPDEKLPSLISGTKDVLKKLGVKGTVLLSREGYNAQLAIPTPLLQHVQPELAAVDQELYGEIDINIGHTIDYDAPGSAAFPFKKLLVRQKRAILTDGLAEGLDWSAPGPEMPAELWHASLGSYEGSDKPLVLDCRNKYESDVGTFEGAVPLNTTFFRESWPVLDALLRDTPRDAPLLTFCTGGIRCVKVNAYLQQRLGFTNTHRLAGGIIAYDRWLAEQNQNQGREHKEAHEASSIKPVSELPPEDSRQLMDTSAGRVGKVRGAVEDVSDTQQQGSADAAGQVRSRFLGRNFLFDRRRLGYNTMEA